MPVLPNRAVRRRLIAATALPLLPSGLAHAAPPTATRSTMPSVPSVPWPTRTVTLVVPFPAGSATDQVARLLAEQLPRDLGQPVVVENRPGANGTIGTAHAARAGREDQHTLLVATSTTHAANASLYRRLPYDPIADFVPVSRLAQIPFVLLVHPSVPAKTPQELVAWLRANPGKASWGSGSSGSLVPGHALVSANRLDLVHVPYKGVQPAVVDAIGNTIQVVFADLATAAPQVNAGRLRALAVTSAASHPMFPSLPPLSVVVPGFEMTAWFALYAPAGSDPAAVRRLNALVSTVLSRPETAQRLAPAGFEVTPSTPEGLGLFAAKETLKWAKAVQAAAIVPE